MTPGETPRLQDRTAVVQQDLKSVLHPILPHRQLEERQLVIVSAKDSTPRKPLAGKASALKFPATAGMSISLTTLNFSGGQYLQNALTFG